MHHDAEHNNRNSRQAETTIVTAPAGDLSPLEAAIMDVCNQLHDARKRQDQDTLVFLREELFQLIDAYDETDGDNHPNPAWARPNQRALGLSALGETIKAIDTERLALKYADTDRRLEISLDNLCDRCLRVGRYEEAIAYFLRANDIAPNSVNVLLNGAQALWLAGYHTQANAIFQALLEQPEQLAPTGTLAAYLDCEPRLASMRFDLPALNHLFKLHLAQVARQREGGAS